MFKIFTIFILFIICFDVSTCKGKNYGTLNIVITRFESCKGPKRFDCTNEIAKLSSHSTMTYKVHLKENVLVTNGKLVGTSNGKELLRYQMKKPCDNLLIKSLLQTYVNVTDNCMVLKGLYEFTVDIEAISQKYYNGVYIYGNWTFRSVLYGNNCNFICNLIDLNLTPKGKS